MREILFRGKCDDNGKWVQGDLRHYSSETAIIFNESPGYSFVSSETVGQYTGLNDRHGKRIFEGDICRFNEWSGGGMCGVGEVRYAYQQFIISGGANEECENPFVLRLGIFIPECLEVIGNIHDNPELIGGAEDA